VLNIKSGRSVEIEQRTVHRNVWHSSDLPRDPSWPAWLFELETLEGDGKDMAVAVCLTHDVVQAVKSHLAASSPEVGSLLIARPTCGAGARSIVCGQHAFDLAETLALKINQVRVASRPPLHLFIAAPNAFTFFLGQRQPGLGKSTLYEYDFEGANGGSYKPSLSLPI
ncbi:SAVED domain-containing protein, partial [Kerstersia sp.]|uniref:SAVED domain-containing protein n=1 Tax=Kerstersia sp. TaxID=1930783 RepID=UPI003F8E8C7A